MRGRGTGGRFTGWSPGGRGHRSRAGEPAGIIQQHATCDPFSEGAAEPAGAGEVAEDDCARRVSAALEPVKAVEDEVEPVRERGGVIAWSQGTVVGDRKGHLHDVGMGSA